MQMEVIRDFGLVKVRWTDETGTQRGFIVTPDAYDRLIHRPLTEYTDVQIGEPKEAYAV